MRGEFYFLQGERETKREREREREKKREREGEKEKKRKRERDKERERERERLKHLSHGFLSLCQSIDFAAQAESRKLVFPTLKISPVNIYPV